MVVAIIYGIIYPLQFTSKQSNSASRVMLGCPFTALNLMLSQMRRLMQSRIGNTMKFQPADSLVDLMKGLGRYWFEIVPLPVE